ncbi:glycosyltransferase family 4 protein [Haloarcula sp. H-GB5]
MYYHSIDQMRILRISQEVFPEVVGGGAYHAHALSRDQAHSGHDVTVVTIRDDIDEIVREECSGYQKISYPATVSPLGNHVSVRLYNDLKRVVSEYDILHAHAHFYSASNVAGFLSRRRSTPMIITNHSLISQSVPSWLAHIHLETIGRYTFNSAEKILCYTQEEKTRISRITDTPAVVVSNGVDQNRFSPTGEKSEQICDEKLGILFVGRLVEGKRPQDAIKSFHMLSESGIDANLYICGTGPLKKELKSLSEELGVSDSVKFLGHVEYECMPRIYRSSDVFVLPSRSEGFPRTVMEALSTQTPIVVSELEQIKSIARKAGRTFEPGDIDEMASNIVELANKIKSDGNLSFDGRDVLHEEDLLWSKTVEKTTTEMEKLI